MSEPGFTSETDTTALLKRIAQGDQSVCDELYKRIYHEMRRLSASQLAGERPDHTLQPTALLHEAFLSLVQMKEIDWNGRGHFFAMAARVMRRILIDHARAHLAHKRGGRLTRVDLDRVFDPAQDAEPLLIALNEALTRLEKQSPRAYRLVELKFFAGLSFEEAALALNVSSRTLKRDWEATKRWLYRELRNQEPPEEV